MPIVVIMIVVLSILLWISDPDPRSIVVSWVIALVLPPVSFSGAFFLRDNPRAFFVGMFISNLLYSAYIIDRTDCVFRGFEDFQFFTQPLNLSPSSFIEDGKGIPKSTAVSMVLSLFSGFFSWIVFLISKFDRPRER